MDGNTPEAPPVPHQADRARKIPYHKIFTAFSRLVPFWNGGIRGGHRVEGKTPRQPYSRNPDNHVSRSFDSDQNAHVGRTLGRLKFLAEGRTLEPDIPEESFAQKIVKHFQTQPETERHFTDAFKAATLELYRKFADIYPNLMPALNKILQIGGTEGTIILLADSASFLDQAMKGGLNDAVQQVQSRDRFASRTHYEYEVQCSGEEFANTITQQTKEAAVTIASDPKLVAQYDPSFDINTTRIPQHDFRTAFEACIAQGVAHAEELHTQGKI